MSLMDSLVVTPLSLKATLRYLKCEDFLKLSFQPLCPSVLKPPHAEIMGRIAEVLQKGLQKVKMTHIVWHSDLFFKTKIFGTDYGKRARSAK